MKTTAAIGGLFLLLSSCTAQTPGSVTATVIDANGKTVQHAIAYAYPLGKMLITSIPQCRTDETGSQKGLPTRLVPLRLRWNVSVV